MSNTGAVSAVDGDVDAFAGVVRFDQLLGDNLAGQNRCTAIIVEQFGPVCRAKGLLCVERVMRRRLLPEPLMARLDQDRETRFPGKAVEFVLVGDVCAFGNRQAMSFGESQLTILDRQFGVQLCSRRNAVMFAEFVSELTDRRYELVGGCHQGGAAAERFCQFAHEREPTRWVVVRVGAAQCLAVG